MAVEVEAGAYINMANQFSHNPLHDLESLWWVGVWFILCHYNPSRVGDPTVQEHIKDVKEIGKTLFNNRIDPHRRREALVGSTLFPSIEPLSFPPPVQHLIAALYLFKNQLVTYYESYNPKVSQNRSFFTPDIYCKFGDVIEKAMKGLGNAQTELWPLDHIEDRITFLSNKK